MTFTLVLKATLILSAAAMAAGLLRRGSAAQRHLVWTLAFVALLAMPFVPAIVLLPQSALIVAATGGGAATASSTPWLYWLWLAGAAVALIRLAASHAHMASMVDAPAAMTWGILRPRILGPWEGIHQLDLRHEQAHIARRDGLWQLVAQLACAVYWFHPLVWWAERRAAQERERACDDLVLSSGADPADYAQRLVDAARALATPPVAALAISGESGLVERVRAILDPAVNRRHLRLRDFACGLVMAALVLAPLSAQQPVEKADTNPVLLHKVEPGYSEEAQAARIEGPMELSCVVRTDGSFTDIKVVKSLGHGLDAKAIAAMKQWRAKPAMKDGKAVDYKSRVVVNFRLQ